MPTFTQQQRKDLARKGLALADGSFPIRNKSDLSNAVSAFGRSGNKAAAKRHIIKRARALGAVSMLPKTWGVKEADVGDKLSEADRSHDKIRELVHAAIRDEFKRSSPDGDFFPWVREVFDDRAVFQSDGETWQITYTINDEDEVELGEPEEVEMTWVAVGEGFAFPKKDRAVMEALAHALKDDERFARDMKRAAESALDGEAAIEVEGPFVPLIEKAVRQDDTIAVKVIEPGRGSSGYYTADVLERDAPAAFPKGTKMYWDHPTKTEEQERPERSLRDLAAELVSDARFEEDGAEGPGVYADAKVFGPYGDSLEDLAPHIGTSIRALGAVDESATADDGQTGVVEKIVASPHNTIDFVTEPGAGGKVLELFESARRREKPAPRKEEEQMDEREAKALREAKEAADRRVTELQESLSSTEKERDEAKEAAERAQGALLIRQAQDRVGETLDTLAEGKDDQPGITLPVPVRARLTERLANDPPTTDKGELDAEAFDKKVTEAIKAEAKYLAEVTGSGQISGLGESVDDGDAPKPEDAEKQLAESLAGLGMDEKEAASGAKSR